MIDQEAGASFEAVLREFAFLARIAAIPPGAGAHRGDPADELGITAGMSRGIAVVLRPGVAAAGAPVVGRGIAAVLYPAG